MLDSDNGFLFVETFKNGEILVISYQCLSNLNSRNLSGNLHVSGATVALESLILCSESGCASPSTK